MKDKKRIEVIYMDTDKLIPYVNNPRNNENAVDAVASSIKNFGLIWWKWQYLNCLRANRT